MIVIPVIVVSIFVTTTTAQTTAANYSYTSIDYNDRIFTEYSLFVTPVRSVLHCAQLCGQQEFCATFTFHGDLCRGHWAFVTSQTPHVIAPGALSFSWKGRDVNCNEGYYGEDCSRPCDPFCRHVRCSRVTGGCEANVARAKTYHERSRHQNRDNPAHGANGDTRGYYDPNINCIHTYKLSPSDEFHWWQVDLGQPIPVYNITVWERAGNAARLFPFNITVDDRHCVTMTSDPTSARHTSVTCGSVMYGRIVRLTHLKLGGPLNMCELQIYACTEGRHGDDCSLLCDPSCDRNCDRDTGACFTE